MDLKEVMEQKNFVVVGNTVDEGKYAYKIKNKMKEKGYRVSAVGKELASINDVDGDIDIVDLCINPVKGLQMIKECRKDFKAVVIQPGAESQELTEYLKSNGIAYLEGCLLVGLKLFRSRS